MAACATPCGVGKQELIDTIVTDLAGTTITRVSLPHSMLVMDLKHTLKEHTRTPCVVQRLLVGDALLLDSCLLGDFAQRPLHVTMARISYSNCQKEAEALRSASQNGHVSEVRRLLCVPVSPDAEDARYSSFPLMLAALTGSVDIVRLLCEAQADVNKKTNTGASALQLAVGRGYVQIARYLLDARANPESTQKDGGTPLLAAAAGGHSAIVSMLLEAGASAEKGRASFCRTGNDDNLQTHVKLLTPLTLALHRHHYRSAYLLRANGACPLPLNAVSVIFRRDAWYSSSSAFPVALVATVVLLMFHMFPAWVALAMSAPPVAVLVESTLPRRLQGGCCPSPSNWFFVKPDLDVRIRWTFLCTAGLEMSALMAWAAPLWILALAPVVACFLFCVLARFCDKHIQVPYVLWLLPFVCSSLFLKLGSMAVAMASAAGIYAMLGMRIIAGLALLVVWMRAGRTVFLLAALLLFSLGPPWRSRKLATHDDVFVEEEEVKLV